MEQTSLHSPHHSAVQIARLVREGRAAADPHLAECPLCAEIAGLLKHETSGKAEAVTTVLTAHPSADELSTLVLTPAPAGAEAHLEHVSQCGQCATKVRELITIFDADPAGPPAMLRSSTPQWRRQMAARMSRSQQNDDRRWIRHAAIAASLFVLTFLGYRTYFNSGPGELLAEAYTLQRPFDYRLPDNGYGRVSQRMSGSSTFDKPAPLIEAQARLSKLPGELVARGRAELLEGDTEAAVATLERARETMPVETVALDLACAYAARGDAAHPEDHAKALDLLERLLRAQPDSPAALFNRALVLERMMRFDDAIETWDRYLKADSSSQWAAEARERRENAVQKKNIVNRP